MGTRAYAEEVCAAIDPDGTIFGGRLLSRDETGSLTQKSLQRLFPCDTSMVVIIDDRADVWEWSPNLIKVIPCKRIAIDMDPCAYFRIDDFFVGIGDINSTFLPKVDPITAGPPLPTDSSPSSSKFPSSSTLGASLPATSVEPSIPEERKQGREQDAQDTKQMVAANSLTLEAQLEERPLAKQQEALLDEGPESSSNDNKKAGVGNAKIQDKLAQGEKPTPKALLKNDDVELQRVNSVRQFIFLVVCSSLT